MLITYLILQRLDYCNGVLAGLPASSIRPLQGVQNAAARLVLTLYHRAHITPALQQLHWLPVHYRIQYKIATLMHHCTTLKFYNTVTLLQTTSVIQSVFHQHDPSDQLRMELLLFNVHVRDWVTVLSPSLTSLEQSASFITANCFRCCFQKM